MNALHVFIDEGDFVGLMRELQESPFKSDDFFLSGSDFGRVDESPLRRLIVSDAFSHDQVVQCVTALLDAGAKPDYFAFDEAACRGLLDVCLDFLKRDRALAFFCSWDLAMWHVPCFHVLLSSCLEACPIDNNGHCIFKEDLLSVLLCLACRQGCSRVVRALLEEYQSNPNARFGKKILGATFSRQDVSAFESCFSIQDKDCQHEICTMLLDSGAICSEEVLTEAIRSGALGAVKAVLEKGDVAVESGHCPPLTAIGCAVRNNDTDMLRLLLEYGAKADESLNLEPPIFTACTFGQDCVPILIDAGADVASHRLDRYGQTSLLYAVASNQTKSLIHLLAHGADPNGKSAEGTTPLQYACNLLHLPSIVVLLEGGADPDGIDLTSVTPPWQKLDVHQRDSLVHCVRNLLKLGKSCWPTWSRSSHHYFPNKIRDAIFTLLLCFRRKDCVVSSLPVDVLWIVVEYVASRNGWQLKISDFSRAFINHLTRFSFSELIPTTTKSRLCTRRNDQGCQFQAFYACRDCHLQARDIGEGIHYASLCAECAENCHARHGHKIFFNSIFPGECECFRHTKCCCGFDNLSLLGSAEYRSTIEDAESEFEVMVCIAKQPRFKGFLNLNVGDIVKVKRTLGILKLPVLLARVDNVAGSVSPDERCFRNITQFGVAICNHKATLKGELSFKKGDLILLIGPLIRGKGQLDPWEGKLFTKTHVAKGWVESWMIESCEDCTLVSALEKQANFSVFVETIKSFYAAGNFMEDCNRFLHLANVFSALCPEEQPRFGYIGMSSHATRHAALCCIGMGDHARAFELAQESIASLLMFSETSSLEDLMYAYKLVILSACRLQRKDQVCRYYKKCIEFYEPHDMRLMHIHFAVQVSNDIAMGKSEGIKEKMPSFFPCADLALYSDMVLSWKQFLRLSESDVLLHHQNIHRAFIEGNTYLFWPLIEATMHRSMLLIPSNKDVNVPLWGKQVCACIAEFISLVRPIVKNFVPSTLTFFCEKVSAFFLRRIFLLLQADLVADVFDIVSVSIKFLQGEMSLPIGENGTVRARLFVQTKDLHVTVSLVTINDKEEMQELQRETAECARDDGTVSVQKNSTSYSPTTCLTIIRDQSSRIIGVSFCPT